MGYFVKRSQWSLEGLKRDILSRFLMEHPNDIPNHYINSRTMNITQKINRGSQVTPNTLVDILTNGKNFVILFTFDLH